MVYIDDYSAKFGRMIMCHMMADTTQELLEMADKIGVARKWIQYPRTRKEHFDVCLSMKKKAIALGAQECGWRKILELMNRTKSEYDKKKDDLKNTKQAEHENDVPGNVQENNSPTKTGRKQGDLFERID